MQPVKNLLPAVAVLAVLIGVWWLTVRATHSVIFPTPWDVVTGTAQLIRDGSLWRHIRDAPMCRHKLPSRPFHVQRECQ